MNNVQKLTDFLIIYISENKPHSELSENLKGLTIDEMMEAMEKASKIVEVLKKSKLGRALL